MFQELNISNVSTFLIDSQSYTFLLLNVTFRHFYLTTIAELFRGRSLLRNSTLITSRLTVL